MFENLDELIEINLNLLCKTNTKSIMRNSFQDQEGNSLRNSDRFANILNKKRLIDLEKGQGYRCDLTEFGHTIFKNGGWLEYLRQTELLNEKELLESKLKENLEIELATSNLEANKLNKKIAEQNTKNEKQNKIATWVNIGIGIINAGLLIWQILKGE